MRVCNCSLFCCTLLCVHSSIAIILMGKRELIALLHLSSWCLVMVERLFLAVPWGCLRFVIVVFPDHTHLLFLLSVKSENFCMKNWLTSFSSLPRKKIARLADHPDKTIAVDWEEKQQNKQTNNTIWCVNCSHE